MTEETRSNLLTLALAGLVLGCIGWGCWRYVEERRRPRMVLHLQQNAGGGWATNNCACGCKGCADHMDEHGRNGHEHGPRTTNDEQ